MPMNQKFTVSKIISNSKLCESCLVEEKKGELFFAKTIANNVEIDPHLLALEFERSFQLHLKLKHPQINSAVRKIYIKRRPYFLSQYLSPKLYTQLGYHQIKDDVLEFLIQSCMLIDFIHLNGYVHCDIKKENFLVSNLNRFKVTLIDFDFLCTIGYKYDKLIIGSPEHISPEIYTNAEITPLVDSYSYGFMLKRLFESTEQTSSETIEKIKNFSNKLLSKNQTHRPYYLIDALEDFELIDQKKRKRIQKQVFSSILFQNYYHRNSKKLLKLLDDSKIVGIQTDFIEDLEKFRSVSKRAWFDTVKNIILNSDIERESEYWHLQIPDSEIDRLYNNIPTSSKISLALIDIPEDQATTQKLQKIQLLIDKHKYTEAAHCFRSIESTSLQNDSEQSYYLKLGIKIHEKLHKFKKAVKLYEELFRIQGDEHDFEELHTYIQLLFRHIEYEKADKLVKSFLADQDTIGDPVFLQRLLRHKSWIHHARGEKDKAVKTAEECLRLAIDSEMYESLIQCYYLLGLYKWSEGAFLDAIDFLEKANAVVKNNRLDKSAFNILFLLASINIHIGNFSKSIKYCDEALKLIKDSGKYINLSNVSLIKSLNYINLYKFSKAEYWINQAIHYNQFQFSPMNLFTTLFTQSQFHLIKSEFSKSKNFAFKATSFRNFTIPNVNQIYLDLNFLKLQFYQGNYQECKKNCIEIMHSISTNVHKPIECESSAFSMLNDHFNNGIELDKNRFYENLREFKESSTGHPYCHVLMISLFLDIDDVRDNYEELLPEYSNFELFECIELFVSTYKIEESLRIFKYKKIYTKLINSSQLFLAFLCSNYIAQYYLRTSREKLAQNYFLNARNIAESIGNKHLIHASTQNLSALQEKSDSRSTTLELFYELSNIFKYFNTTENPFQKMLFYVLNQTGAERAVLFFKNPENDELYVKEYVNCDSQSLDDIKDYSSKVLKDVIYQNKPHIIGDAQSDKQTKVYESIVLYNIQSLVCLPLEREGEVFGAIYIDHHVLSQIFSTEEITYMKTISQFISSLISITLDQKELRSFKTHIIDTSVPKFMTSSPKVLDMLKLIPDIANSSNPVLLVGESGTGKEILAEYIYNQSMRSDKPLVRLNITTIPQELFESEFFGIEDKVATSVQGRMGKLEAADGGTLFIDEIGDTPLSIQPKLLSAVEYQYFSKVGSTKMIYTDIRFIYATNKNLSELIKENKFREDLYYRISNFTLHIPPLRERQEDIEMFLDYFSKNNNSNKQIVFSKHAKDALLNYSWPGNVRQLKHTINSLAWLSNTNVIHFEDLPIEVSTGLSIEESHRSKISQEEEKELIILALEKCKWHYSNSSKLLGIPLSTLRYKMKKYGIVKP